MDNHSLQKKCTKTWCKTLIPLDAKFKACNTCRTCDQEAQKKKRSRKKATVTTRVSTGSKHGPGNIPDTEERPTRRARSGDGIVGVPGVAIDLDEDEDDEDGLFGESHDTVSLFCEARTYHPLKSYPMPGC
jgi:hypothetical protein